MSWLRISTFLFLLSVQTTLAATDVYFFYAQGCRHCEDAQRELGPFFRKHPSVNVHKFEVRHNRTNREKLAQFGQAYGTNIDGVPAIFVGDDVFVGFSESTRRQIEAKVIECERDGCQSPM